MSFERALDDALDKTPSGTVEVESERGRAEVDVVESGRIGVRVRSVKVSRAHDRPIEEVMNPNPATIFPTDNVQTAISRMARGGFRRLPVVDEENRPLAMLKVTAILHYLVQHFPEFVYNLPPSPDDTTH